MKKIFPILALLIPALLWSGTMFGFSHTNKSSPDTTDCQAFFIPNQDNQNPLTFQFMDASFPQGAATSWNWSFGDGTGSMEQNPSHTYSSAGDYPVTLLVTSANCSSELEMVIHAGLDTTGCNCAGVYDPVCVGSPIGGTIEFPNECEAICAGFTPNDFVDCDIDTSYSCEAWFEYFPDDNDYLTIEFQEFSYAPTPVTEIIWEFGDGSTATGSMPSHTYAQAGEYEVSLTITTEGGCTSTTELEVNVTSDPGGCNCPTTYDPVCVATPNGVILEFTNECIAICEGFTPNTFVPCDDSTGGSFCEAMFCFETDLNNPLQVIYHDFSFAFSDITGWVWDFGDGATSTEQNPTHTYADYGVYAVTLSITTASGCSSMETMEVWLEDYTPCSCPPEYNPVCVQTPSGEVIPFWNACEAECYGFTDFVACDSLPVNDCDAAFGYYQDFPSNDLTVEFEDYSYAVTDIQSWAWDFGDGTTSTEQNPEHTYAAAGDYTVSLTITSANCTSTMEQPVYVGDFQFPECQAFFWPFPDSIGDLSYQFFDLSLGAPTSWTWDFGDGTTSTEQNPVHTYATAGTYTVSLMISGDSCQSSFELVLDTDDFYTQPNTPSSNNIQALYTPVIDMDKNTVYFKNQSTSSSAITDITYQFGDGQQASAANVQHLFPAKKAYSVTMQVKNEAGEISNFVGTVDLTTGLFKSSTSGSSIILGNRQPTKEDFAMALSPNPVTTDLNVLFTTSVAGKYQLEVTTLTGQALYTKSFNGTKGRHQVDMDVQNIPQGMYFLKLRVNDSYQTYKFVKE